MLLSEKSKDFNSNLTKCVSSVEKRMHIWFRSNYLTISCRASN